MVRNPISHHENHEAHPRPRRSRACDGPESPGPGLRHTPAGHRRNGLARPCSKRCGSWGNAWRQPKERRRLAGTAETFAAWPAIRREVCGSKYRRDAGAPWKAITSHEQTLFEKGLARPEDPPPRLCHARAGHRARRPAQAGPDRPPRSLCSGWNVTSGARGTSSPTRMG